VAGADVSAASAGTKVTAVTVTTAPSGDVVVYVVRTSLEVRGGVVVAGALVVVVNVVSGGEDEDRDDDGVGVGVLLVLGVLLVAGGTLVVLGGAALLELVLLGRSDVDVEVSLGGSEVDVSGSVEVSVGVNVGVTVGLALLVVALVSWRRANCTIEVARVASTRWTASNASRSDGNTPSRN
jgi:hypothetical protein